MDLNYLYHRRQVALFMSEKAASDGARPRIAALRTAMRR